jgi:Ser/Thr protein kinase RdoA (MazF antagonist)
MYDGAPVRPLHADLHGGNLKWHEGRLAVFDFDDCGLGLPALDLAVAAFYLRGNDPALERALTAGYVETASLPDVDPAHFEAMVAARQLLLANSLLATSTAELRREAGLYLGVTVGRMRHWLETGTFTRVLSGA